MQHVYLVIFHKRRLEETDRGEIILITAKMTTTLLVHLLFGTWGGECQKEEKSRVLPSPPSCKITWFVTEAIKTLLIYQADILMATCPEGAVAVCTLLLNFEK